MPRNTRRSTQAVSTRGRSRLPVRSKHPSNSTDNPPSLMDKISNSCNNSDTLIEDGFELRTANALLHEVIQEMDRKRTSLMKSAPVAMKIAEKLARIKEINHNLRYSRNVTVRMETVALVFKQFETLVKVVCGNDIDKLEQFAAGLKDMGAKLIEAHENQRRG